ncbi:MAG: hypothetical protein NZ561_04035 [Phycisphaerae bacterium]|nr:hypothetical protein [Phycisphaerae bacterium]MDW8261231.1 hypothetical protein [Phycisphaerales bacterium]
MPPKQRESRQKTLEQVVAELNLFPLEAFLFVTEGLTFTAERHHGPRSSPDQNRHVTGQQLCEGLRDYALQKYGMLAGTVLRRWGLRSTLDFGRIVYALIDAGFFGKTDTDSIEDFRDVYDFRAAFDGAYKIQLSPE